MKAKLLFLLPAIAMLIACGSNNEQSSGNTSTSQGGTTSGETSQETSEGSSQETSSSEGGESSSSEAPDGYQTVQFAPGEFGAAMASQGSFEATVKGLKLTAKESKLHQVYNSEDIELRVYVGGSITFSATSIKGITFTTEESDEKGRYAADCLSTTTGSYTASGTTGTWTGEAASVKFDSASKQTRIISFTVTYK